MAKGARNKQKKKNRRIRSAIFDERRADKIKEIAPDLEELRADLAKQQEAEADGMEDHADKPKIDPKTKKDENGQYASYLSQREVKTCLIF